MLKKRYLIIAVGVVSVLLAGLFVNNLILAQSGEYDPWLDYNEDGVVDVRDLQSLSQTYSASGNPSKDVNVTNWPSLMNVNVTNWGPTLGPNITVVDRITLFRSWGDSRTRVQLHTEEGATYTNFVFEFKPMREVNITEVWLQITLTEGVIGGSVWDCWFDVSINGQTNPRVHTKNYAKVECVSVARLNITDIREAIVQGMNTLEIDSRGRDAGAGWWPPAAFEITLFIEYKTN